MERFESMASLHRQGKEPVYDHYEVVYTGVLPPYTNLNMMLEGLYEKFNIDHPSDFRGHSLSVSDIVAIKTAGVVSCHYVDSIGFAELPGFMKSANYLKNAEMAMEDDYGMIDGVINNGKVDASDAQLTYNMYNAVYSAFDADATVEKFLRADVNGDKIVNVEDATAIVGSLLQ